MSRFQKGASNAFFVAAVEFLQGSYAGNVLSVNKLDRLGRSAVDISAAAAGLAAAGVRVHCLAPGGVDLTSAAGMLIMYVINAEAGFERDLHIERTQAGFRRAIAEGRHPGRPHRLSGEERQSVLEHLAAGANIASLARKFKTSRQTIMCAEQGFCPGNGPRRKLKQVFLDLFCLCQ